MSEPHVPNLEERKIAYATALEHINRAGGNIKLAAQAAKQENQDQISMHAVDTIVNMIQLGDVYGINIMQGVFNKLKQLDRRPQ